MHVQALTPKSHPGPIGALTRALEALQPARRWLRAFRRTRPFWGGLWLIVGGWLVLTWSMVDFSIIVLTGLTGLGGWVSGGGMILCGLGAWAAPSQRYVIGVVGLLLAVASLVLSNLGGWFIGMFFGIIGGAMVLAWGPRRPRTRRAVPSAPVRPRPSPNRPDPTGGEALDG